ncbi:MAG TPA: SDR family oxidoreductase [Candidatus Binatia bacterium]|nr:SDR family oxidoreductase [Candidatus Binatia bacterium]
MAVVVVSGSASGIGAAVRARLERAGVQVLGVDLRDAEVVADLATAPGRAAAVAATTAACGGRLDGLVACAGVGPQFEPRQAIVALDYFGAEALLAGLRPALAAAARPAAVAVSSNSATLAGAETPLVAACLAGDEAEARRLAADLPGAQVYAGAKLALARWVRRHAPAADWIGAGVRLNAVAPGAVRTPLLEAGLEHPVYGPAIRGFPIPAGGFGTPDQVAAAIAFLLDPDAAFCCGSVLFVDGGTDALVRGDVF